jgi:ribulose-phosphate 3-epimerase
MPVVAPALLCETDDMYKQTVERLMPFAQRVHIDISDGEFAPTFTVSADRVYWAQNWQADIHAMVARPSEYVQKLVAMKPNLIIFHAEAGIALQRATVPATIAGLIEKVDHVMIFSGTLGHYGGTASLMQLEKVRLIKEIRPTVEIGWDGGVNVENAFSLAQGGVDVLNAGGAIAKSDDPAAAYAALVNESNKHGVI